RSFKDIVGREWGEWLLDAGVVDIDNELEKRLAAMLPEQIIETYYNAIDEQDHGLAYACFSKRNITYSLFTNMDYSDLFNESYSEAYVNGIENIEAIKMEDAKPYDPEMGKDFVGYAVYLDIKFRKEIIQTSGKNKMFVILTNEVEDLGWRIHSIGTGP
ncbi:MAG: DUF4829 domain-containing protein, partial [bacterium]|nr:DUF4829 domain-containing protein [bacterium]